MKPWLPALLVLALAYQMVALPLYRFGPAVPDFVLIVIAYVALEERRGRALTIGLLTGLVVDALSLEPWGVHGLGYTVASMLLLVARRVSRTDDVAVRFLLVALASLTVAGLRFAMLWKPGATTLAEEALAAGATALYNGILGSLVFALLDPVRTRLVTPARGRFRP